MLCSPRLSQSTLCADTPTTLQECGPAQCRTILEQPHLSQPLVIASGHRGQRSGVKAAHPSIQRTRPCPPWCQLLQGVGLSGDFGNCPQRRDSVQLKWLVWRSPRPLCPLGRGTEQGSKGPPQGRGQQGPGWSRRGHISQSSNSSQAWSGGGPRAALLQPGVRLPPSDTRTTQRVLGGPASSLFVNYPSLETDSPLSQDQGLRPGLLLAPCPQGKPSALLLCLWV